MKNYNPTYSEKPFASFKQHIPKLKYKKKIGEGGGGL